MAVLSAATVGATNRLSASVAPAQVIDIALKSVGMKGEAGTLTRQALLRNLDIAIKLGCLDTEDLEQMRRGKASTVRHDPYAGDQLSVDHIIPRAVCPELDNVIANPLQGSSDNGEATSRRIGGAGIAGLESESYWGFRAS